MELRILLFGGAAAAVRADHVTVRVPDACTGEQALRALREMHPSLRAFAEAGRLAVNHAFARPEQTIRGGDEVALISLVSGG